MRLKVSVIVDVDTTDTDIEDMRDEILKEAKFILDHENEFALDNVIITPLSNG